MATAEQEAQATYLRDHWDSQSKAVGFLLTAHGVALVSCLAFLKDYEESTFDGIGKVIVLAALGLFVGSLSYGALVGCRSLEIRNVLQGLPGRRKVFFWPYVIFCIACYLIFVAVIGLVACLLRDL